jgi:N-acetylmuramoyl-L-alanine amidase
MSRSGERMALIRRDVLEAVQRILLALLVVIALAIITLSMHVIWTWGQASDTTPGVTPTSAEVEAAAPTVITATAALPATVQAEPLSGSTPTVPANPKIGIVAGHWEHDSGAVCPDGLQEVDVNLAVAQRVVSMLSMSGYVAEILAEFSPQLNGYQATAVVSIHADSCNVPEASGFKVARVSASVVPELEDRLVACLIDRYSETTGLRFHRNSITYDMTEYHAFYEIAPQTPAAIIEIGFLGADRHLLTRRQDLVAQGIVDGIKCFVESTR